MQWGMVVYIGSSGGWLSMGRVVQAAAGHAVWGDADTQQLDLVWPSGSTSQVSQTSMGKRFQIARSFISEDAAHFEVDGHVANAADDVRLPFRLQVFRQNFSYDSLLAEGELDLAPLIAAAPRDQAETKTLVDVVAIARSAGGSSSSSSSSSSSGSGGAAGGAAGSLAGSGGPPVPMVVEVTICRPPGWNAWGETPEERAARREEEQKREEEAKVARAEQQAAQARQQLRADISGPVCCAPCELWAYRQFEGLANGCGYTFERVFEGYFSLCLFTVCLCGCTDHHNRGRRGAPTPRQLRRDCGANICAMFWAIIFSPIVLPFLIIGVLLGSLVNCLRYPCACFAGLVLPPIYCLGACSRGCGCDAADQPQQPAQQQNPHPLDHRV